MTDATESIVPDELKDLLERPLYGHLATLRPDRDVQVNPMWFGWDGTHLLFTHTTKRQKFRNITAHPKVAFSIIDPDSPYRYIELRGTVTEIEPDPTGAFFVELAHRYGEDWPVPADAADRVIIKVTPHAYTTQ